MKEKIENLIKDNIKTSTRLLETQIDNIENASRLISDAFKHDKTLFLFGNGGSAADAQHIAAEFINKFKLDRRPLPAVALTTDTSVITSISNDSGFCNIFERQIRALGKRGDIALAITTSDIKPDGHSSDLAFALDAAKEKGMKTIGFVSDKSKNILEKLDIKIIVPSIEIPRIQESHILTAHIICELVEKEFYDQCELLEEQVL